MKEDGHRMICGISTKFPWDSDELWDASLPYQHTKITATQICITAARNYNFYNNSVKI